MLEHVVAGKVNLHSRRLRPSLFTSVFQVVTSQAPVNHGLSRIQLAGRRKHPRGY